MDSNEARELIRAVKQIADSLERIEMKMCGERPAPVAPKVEDLKDTVTAVRIRGGPRESVTNDGLVQGGTDPKEFWARKDDRR